MPRIVRVIVINRRTGCNAGIAPANPWRRRNRLAHFHAISLVVAGRRVKGRFVFGFVDDLMLGTTLTRTHCNNDD